MSTGYRKKFLNSYVTTHCQHTSDISPRSFEIFSKQYKRRLARYLPPDKSASILDIGCGTGKLLYFLQSQGYENCRGIDMGPEQLEVAAKMGVKNIENADLLDYLKTTAEKYDVIVADQVIEHLTKDEAVEALELIHKTLKPGGRVWVFTPNITSLFGSLGTFGDFTHELVFNAKSLAQLLRVCNFSDVEVSGIGPTPYDLRSGIKTVLWNISKGFLWFFFVMVGGIGGSDVSKMVFERGLFAIGTRR